MGQRENLWDGVKTGSVAEVRECLVLGADPDMRNMDGDTPLHQACYRGRREIVELLCEWGADMEAQNCVERRPLHCAAYAGHVPVVRYLLERCAAVDEMDGEAKTPLLTAVERGQAEIVAALLDHGADPLDQAVMDRVWRAALGCEGTGVLRVLASVGWNLAPSQILDGPLGVLFERGDTDKLGVLLDCFGLEVNDRNENGNSLLMLALLLQQEWSREFSLEQMKWSPKEREEKENDHDMRRLAVNLGVRRTVNYLLERGADAVQKCNFYETPLHLMADLDCWEMIEKALELNPNLDCEVQNGDGMTPLDVAKHCDSDNVVELLREHFEVDEEELPDYEMDGDEEIDFSGGYEFTRQSAWSEVG